MDDDHTTPGGPSDSTPRWPVAWWGPCLGPLDRGELWEVREGGPEADNLEQLAASSARARGALDLGLGDGLAAMRVGDRLVRLGFSCLGDYARETLGIEERTAEKLAHLSRALRTRPLLRAAVRAGELGIRAAQVILPVAKGEVEAAWVELARTKSVRELEDLVRRARSTPGEEDEEWTRFRARLTPEERARVDEALAVAGRVLGPGSSRVQRLEAIAQEYLSERSAEAGDDPERAAFSFERNDDVRERRKAALEAETERWAYLADVPVFAAPDGAFPETATAEEVDAELRRLHAMRESWDDLLGGAAQAVKASGLHRFLGFADFSHYCSERLGLGARTVEQRAQVEERLWEVPALRDEYVHKRLSYEQVRLLSRLKDAEIPAWIPRARELTCVALRRAMEAEHEAQLRAAGTLVAGVPVRVLLTLAAAIRAVRATENRLWSDGRCLVALSEHFLDAWKACVKRQTRSQRIRERDLGRCQVPGCSRPAVHAHHIEFRSRGGGDDDHNLVGICAIHHQFGIHTGYITVSGTAPHGLVWKLGGEVWMGPRKAGPGLRS